MLKNITQKFNPISVGNIINSAGQVTLIGTIMLDFDTDLTAKFLIYMTAATVALNHYRNYLPTVLNKRIWQIEINLKIHMLFVFLGGCVYFLLQQLLYEFFISKSGSLIEGIFWLPYLVFGFMQVFYVILASARGARKETGISLAIGGTVMSVFALMTFMGAIKTSPVLFFTISYLIQSLYLFWAIRHSDILPIDKQEISRPSLKNYFLYFLLEAPTRPIPFLEKSIASLAGPINVIAIEIIQRFFMRPVSLIASGNLLDTQNELLSLKRSDKPLLCIFVDVVNIFKFKIMLIYPASVIIVYALYSDAVINDVLIIGIIFYTLNLITLAASDLCRKFVLGFESAVYSMSINLAQGILNLLLLYLMFQFDFTWAVYPLATTISVSIGWLTYVTFIRGVSR